MAKKSVEIHKSGMSDEIQREALQVASLALNMYETETEIANYIQKEFERKHGGSWNCVVGKFGGSLHFNPNRYINFSVGDRRIFLFKSA